MSAPPIVFASALGACALSLALLNNLQGDSQGEKSPPDAPAKTAPGEESPSAKGQSGPFDHPVNPHAPGPDPVQLGLQFRAPGQERFEFVPWESEDTINEVLKSIRGKPGGAEIHFMPGVYEVHQRIFVNEAIDLTISGSPGTTLAFRDGPDKITSLAEPVERLVLTMMVEEPDKMERDRRYQIYKEDGRHDRILEFEVLNVVDGVVQLTARAHYMPHVKEVPAGSWIMEELNFFRVRRCPNLTIQGLTLDGRNRGGIRGHTIYCGIHASGHFKENEKATTHGLHVRNCTFKNLKGRGVVFYGLGGVVIENNTFENIRAQAIEVDHLSSGHIKNNYVNGAEVGVMLNDAYETIVEGNHLQHCEHGVRFLALYHNGWANVGNIVRDNVIGPGGNAGVHFFSKGMKDNLITGNTFVGLTRPAWVIKGEGNRIELDDETPAPPK